MAAKASGPRPPSAPISTMTVADGPNTDHPVSLLRIKGSASDPKIVFRLDLSREDALALAAELQTRAG